MSIFFRWLVTACYLLSLPFLRRGWDFVRARGGDSCANALPLAAGAALVGALLWHLAARKRESRIGVYLLFAAICAVAVALFRSLAEPIARIHIAQYALLGVLVFWAMDGPREGWTCCFWAALAASALGLADEVLQGLLPSRIYDLQDVALNTKAVLLGEAVILFVLRPWERAARAQLPGGGGRGFLLAACACAIAVLLTLLNIALVEKGTPTLGGRERAALRERNGFRHFGAAAISTNALGIAVAAALLAISRGPLRGAGRGLRSAAACGLLPPLILLAGMLLRLRFR